MTDQDSFPAWLWWGSVYALVGVIGIALVVLLLILMGIANPKPVGALTLDASLDDTNDWEIGELDGVSIEAHSDNLLLSLAEADTKAFVATPYRIGPPGTIELAATLQSGPDEAGYGLWWGESADQIQGVVAVNGNGYLTILRADEPFMEWQPFPHVKSAGNTNRLRVYIEADQVVVRINDELAASFESDAGESFQIGLYTETFNNSGAVIAFEWIRVWQE